MERARGITVKAQSVSLLHECAVTGETYLLIGCLSPCYRVKVPVFRVFFSGELKKEQMNLVLSHVINSLASLHVNVVLTSSDAAFDYMKRHQTTLSLCDAVATEATELAQRAEADATAEGYTARQRKLAVTAAHATRTDRKSVV